MCFRCYGNLKFPYGYNGKSGNWHLFLCYCRYLTKVLLKCFWSSSLTTIWISSNYWLWLVAMAIERLIFLACNIYSILAEYSLHSCTFRWALWPIGLWFRLRSIAIELKVDRKRGLRLVCLHYIQALCTGGADSANCLRQWSQIIERKCSL